MEEAFEKAIIQKKFRTSAVGGYHKEDVDKTIFELCKAMSDLRQNHGFLLDQVKRYQEKEQSIATAILSAQTTAREIVEAAQAEARSLRDHAAAVLRDAEQKAGTIVTEAENLASDVISENGVHVALMHEKARTIITEAEKLAGEIVSDADVEAARKQEEAERSVAFASAYQDVLGQMDGKLNHLLSKHIVAFLSDLTATVKAEADQGVF